MSARAWYMSVYAAGWTEDHRPFQILLSSTRLRKAYGRKRYRRFLDRVFAEVEDAVERDKELARELYPASPRVILEKAPGCFSIKCEAPDEG